LKVPNILPVKAEQSDLLRVEKAVDFILNYTYNSTLNLCKETRSSNVYWLVSDNLWAWKALKLANISGLSNAAEAGIVANEIRAKLMYLAGFYGLPIDAAGLPKSYAHEAVIGDVVLPPYRTDVNCTLYRNDFVLNMTMRNGIVMEDWMHYADLLLYASLSNHWLGNYSQALTYYNMAVGIWNETSVGIQDVVANLRGTYETYKLALLLLTSKVLGKKLSFESQLVDRIWQLQRDDGGIITHYMANGTAVPGADANTETTSLVIMAMLASPANMLPNYIYASDSNGREKHVFQLGEQIYATVPAVGKNVTFYILTNKSWSLGDSFEGYSVYKALNVHVGNGTVWSTVSVWSIPNNPSLIGAYDIAMDTNNNGVYDDDDHISDITIYPGLFIVPEALYGTLSMLYASLTTFALLRICRNRKSLKVVFS